MKYKKFPLRVVLTVTTGRLLTKNKGPRDNGIDALYQILNWMFKTDVTTLGLCILAEKAKPILFQKYPELEGVNSTLNMARLDKLIADLKHHKDESTETATQMWMDWMMEERACGLKSEYEIPQLI